MWGNKDCDRKFVRIIKETGEEKVRGMVGEKWEGKLHDLGEGKKKPDVKELTTALLEGLGLKKISAPDLLVSKLLI